MGKTYTFGELCKAVGKATTTVRNMQTALDLYVPSSAPVHRGSRARRSARDRYSGAYLRFLRKVIALRTFNVPMEDIHALFLKEKKILELLHFDTMTTSPTWYLDACGPGEMSENHLLLTGYNLDFPLASEAIQSNLNFGRKDAELFAGAEMGEDVRRVLRLYLKLLRKIRARIETEKPVLVHALAWARSALNVH
jgi:hypothetical protein